MLWSRLNNDLERRKGCQRKFLIWVITVLENPHKTLPQGLLSFCSYWSFGMIFLGKLFLPEYGHSLHADCTKNVHLKYHGHLTMNKQGCSLPGLYHKQALLYRMCIYDKRFLICTKSVSWNDLGWIGWFNNAPVEVVWSWSLQRLTPVLIFTCVGAAL